jgi:uncharacterized damage-inducible protein DinB
MTEFAPWVEPVARRFRDNRERTLGLARTLGDDQLRLATGDTGWCVREELAHIAASDADFLRTLAGLLRGEPVDMSVFSDIDARNAQNLAERAGLTRHELFGELERTAVELQRLLARLSNDDATRQPRGVPFPIGGVVDGYGHHEAYHVGQIEAAVTAKTEGAR